MDSAKKSVEKILEIAEKHGYACVVGFYKLDKDSTDIYSGATGSEKDVTYLMGSSIDPMYDHYKDGVKDGE